MSETTKQNYGLQQYMSAAEVAEIQKLLELLNDREMAEKERILEAFRSTTMYREATAPMREALVMADSLLSLVAYRQPHALVPDLRREFIECSQLCRRLTETPDA